MAGTEYVDYIPNLIDYMLSNMESSDSNIMIIKHYNTFDLKADFIEELSKSREQACFLYHSFEADDMLSAYEPFIQWIRELYYENPEESLEHFFERCNVYLLHRPIFLSYFQTGVCKREEDLLFIEYEFEHKRLIDEIVEMLYQLSVKKPLVLVLNKLHAAGNSTLNVVKKLLTSRYGKRIAIIGTYNENAIRLSYMKDTWKSVLDLFETYNCVIDWTLNNTPLESDCNIAYKFNVHKIDEYYTKLNNMYCMLAFDQALYYLELLYHKFEIERVYVDLNYKFNFLEIFALICMYKDKTSDALLLCNELENLVGKEKNQDWEYRQNYVLAQVHMYSYQQELTIKFVNKCIKVSNALENEYYLFKAELLGYMAEFYGWRYIWLHGNECPAEDSLIEKAKKFNYKNYIAHIFVFSYDNVAERFADVDKLEQTLAKSKQGIRIAEQIGNDQLLVLAYKKNVMMASTNGYYDVANYFYKKCSEVVVRKNDIQEQMEIYNGMGYNASTMELYEKANEYYSRALVQCVKMQDMDFIAETIYNMAVNAILAGEYALAESHLATCIRIIDAINENSVRVCNVSKIYGLRAYCCYRLGITYNCKINMKYVEQFLGHIIKLEDEDAYPSHLWDDDLYLYYFVNAMLFRQENKLEQALLFFEKAKKYVDRAVGSKFFNLPPYAIEYASLCKELGLEERAKEILNECIEYCDSKGYAQKKAMVQAEMEGKTYERERVNLEIKGVDMEEIFQMATSVGIVREHESQKEEIAFLSIWHKLVNNVDTTMERMFENAITTLKNHNNLDEFIFIRIEDDVPVLRYNDTKYDITPEMVEYMVDYFDRNRSEFAITRLDKGYTEHKTFIDTVFGFNSINTVICAPIFVNEQLNSLFVATVLINEDWNYMQKKYKFSANDVSIMMLLFRQLLDAMDRIEAHNQIKSINKELQFANERLKNQAVRDNLTGLYNRQGFAEEVESLIFDNLETDMQLHLSFLYADLDNFKYYNDTFGHDIGDLILKEFSAIISNICRGRGFAVRYGGDEFILVLYSNNREEIEAAAKMIYERLEAERGFVEKIRETMQKQIQIPKEKYLSCSVGIAETVIYPEDNPREKIDETLAHADKMMYYVKKTTKHRYVFYEDVETN